MSRPIDHVDPTSTPFDVAALVEEIRIEQDPLSAFIILRARLGRTYAEGFRAGHIAGISDGRYAQKFTAESSAFPTADPWVEVETTTTEGEPS